MARDKTRDMQGDDEAEALSASTPKAGVAVHGSIGVTSHVDTLYVPPGYSIFGRKPSVRVESARLTKEVLVDRRSEIRQVLAICFALFALTGGVFYAISRSLIMLIPPAIIFGFGAVLALTDRKDI